MSSEDVNMDEISKKRTREGDAEEQDASKRAKKDDGVSEADASSKGVKPTEAVINDDEAALYDRQIRLWGLDGQQRMRNVNILVIGMRALSNEVVKNIVLSGVGGITILDPATVEPRDLGAQFFLRESDIGSNRAEAVADRVRALNPRVKIDVVTEPIEQQKESFYDGFSVVCATGLDLDTLKSINAICRKRGIKFYAAEVFGFYGYFFCDLLEHSFTQENREVAYGSEIVTKDTITQTYVTLEEAFSGTYDKVAGKNDKKFGQLRFMASPLLFAIQILLKYRQQTGRYPVRGNEDDVKALLELRESHLKSVDVPSRFVPEDLVVSVAAGAGTELAPVTAIVGGQLAQDILKVVSGKDAPINNFFCLNGDALSGHQHRLPPERPKAVVASEVLDLDDD